MWKFLIWRSDTIHQMEVIKIIREADVGESFPIPSVYEERTAARAIVFDTEGKIALS
jgi:hypothetical protein